MIEVIAQRPDDEVKTYMIRTLASYMRQQYLIWNKDSVSEETIFNDINKLSDGRITVPEDVHIGVGISESQNFQRNSGNNGGRNGGNNFKNKGKNNNKRRKGNK